MSRPPFPILAVIDRFYECEQQFGDRELLLEVGDAVTGLIEALEIAQAYVDDAVLVKSQFKPGVVERHANQVRKALARARGDA